MVVMIVDIEVVTVKDQLVVKVSNVIEHAHAGGNGGGGGYDRGNGGGYSRGDGNPAGCQSKLCHRTRSWSMLRGVVAGVVVMIVDMEKVKSRR